WPPHSPLTLKARRRRGNASQQKLINTGAQWRSIRSDSSDLEAAVIAGEGIADPRAVVNQFGTTNAGRSRSVCIPARPFFPLRSETPEIPEKWWERLRVPVAKALENATV